MITTFQTIVRLGSFHKAAEALKYSQPTITFHIQKLESDLGVKLLERGKKLKLTQAGKMFYERADQLLREYDLLNHMMDHLALGESGSIRIGVSEPTASNRLPAILSSFVASHPKVKLSVKVGDSRQLSSMIMEEELDFALCTSPETILETSFQPLLSEQMALLIHDTHPLAAKTVVYLADLKGENFLFTPPNCPIRIKIEQALFEHIGSFYQGIELSSIASHKYYVQANLGITLAPLVAISPPLPGTMIKMIADLHMGPVIGILRKRSMKASLAADKLIDHIAEVLYPAKDRQMMF